ncbi:MAG: transglycosylase SLT domain-containing protein [Bacteroidota bacterium]
MKQCLLIILLEMIFLSGGIAQANYSQSDAMHQRIPSYTEAELKARLNKIVNKVVSPRYNSVVRSYVNTYTVKKRAHTERMLGKVDMYFPLFEKYLLEGNMPTDLKYLPVVESALNPMAVSRSGAVGLWQFMPATGKENGLKINSLVDERKDPNKSTQAAMKYLGRLYRKYGDWSLALAAYNGGPGRVNRAIKRGRSKNFWRIRKYLPRETRNYVPAFIAASYIINFYHEHNLMPEYPDVEMQMAQTTKIYQRMSFQTISEITGTPMHIIKALNPSYKQRFIPSNRKGNYLRLPNQRIGTLLRYLGRPDEIPTSIVASPILGPQHHMYNDNFLKTTVVVGPNEDLAFLADKYNCKIQDIKDWNKLPRDRVSAGQRLLFFVPKVSGVDLLPVALPEFPVEAIRSNPFFEHQLPPVRSEYSVSGNLSKRYDLSRMSKNEKYVYYQLRRRESLLDVANRFPEVSLEELKRLNKLKDGQRLKPGTRIILKTRK